MMKDITQQIIIGLVPMVIGALGTGIGWLARSMLRVRKDIDAAHIKIRCLEEKLKGLL
jgi:hypothetical protein